MDFLDYLWSALKWVDAKLSAAIDWVWKHLVYLAKWIDGFARWVGEHFAAAARSFWRSLKALGSLDFKTIWKKIKRAYERYQDFLDWYDRTFVQPIDRIRNQIWGIYRTLFKPILQVLDSFRVMVRMVALFNRKLAAKLDSRLFALESKLMWPITAALKRLNEISSSHRALVTRLGFLDRVTLLESLRRDASLVWEILTNPRWRLHTDPPGITHRTLAQLDTDFQIYARTGTGPLAEQVDALDQTFREARAELGV